MDVVDFHLATNALFATKDAPWRIKVTVAFMGHKTGCEITLGFDYARPTTELSRTGWHIIAHLVTVTDQWQVHAKIFKWVIASITHQLFDSIRTIRRRAPAHRRLIDLKENPIVTVRAHTRIGRKAKRCRVTSGTAVWQNRRKQSDDRTEPWQSTPSLDALAAGGAMLTNHYTAAPVCAPSRASLLLGVSQGHANVRDNQFDKADNRAGDSTNGSNVNSDRCAFSNRFLTRKNNQPEEST